VGVPVICLDTKKSLAIYSKYSISHVCPDPSSEKDFIHYLVDFGKTLPYKGVLFASMRLLVIITKTGFAFKILSIPMSEWKIIQNCLE
jgi:hypothetical protein